MPCRRHALRGAQPFPHLSCSLVLLVVSNLSLQIVPTSTEPSRPAFASSFASSDSTLFNRFRRDASMIVLQEPCMHSFADMQQNCSSIEAWHTLEYALDTMAVIATVELQLATYSPSQPQGICTANVTQFFSVCQPTIVISGNRYQVPANLAVPAELASLTQLLSLDGDFDTGTIGLLMNHFPNLKGLKISNNMQLKVRLGCLCCAPVTAFSTTSHPLLKILSENVLPQQASALQYLQFVNVPWEHIEDTAFDRFTALQYLLLLHSKIKFLSARSMQMLTSLTALVLTRNAITQVEVGSFNTLSSLSLLDLADNDLLSLPPDLLTPLSKLTIADLSDNYLYTLTHTFFESCTSLQQLDLRLEEKVGKDGENWAKY